MAINVYDLLYEGFYTFRIIISIILLASLFLQKKIKKSLPFVIALAVIYVLVGMSYNILLRFIVDYDVLNGVGLQVFSIFWYCFILSMGFVFLLICYKGKIGEHLFIFACSSLLECVIFGMERLFIDMGVIELRVNTALSLLLDFGVSLAVFIPAFFVFRNYASKKRLENINNNKVFIAYLIGSLAFYLFLSFSLQSLYETLYSTKASVKWVANVLLVVIAAFVLAINLVVVLNINSNAEKNMISLLMNEREKQYNFTMGNIDAINRKAHDLKRQLRAFDLADDETKKEAMKEMADSVSFYDSHIQTSNPTINALFNEKSLYCVNHGIKFTTIVDADPLSFISSIDLYVLFSNLLDNAIEAVVKLDDPNQRVISCVIKSIKGVVTIETNNYFKGGLKLNDGLPMTIKEDKNIHGYGVKSIKSIAKKYGGSLSVSAKDNIYIALVTIPLS